ncbi:MAG: hypothetical protein HYU67_05350 [Flavobacteriia bacterium]|nr:hypothetical protein [Flavobacteriia bacterium]
MKKLTFIFLSLTLLILVVLNNSCKKKIDTIAKVTVKDANGVAVNYCEVILKGVSTIGKASDLSDTAYTNSNGEAIFNFNYIYQKGQAGVAVLDIFARKDEMLGQGIIQIKEETTSTATVVIQE